MCARVCVCGVIFSVIPGLTNSKCDPGNNNVIFFFLCCWYLLMFIYKTVPKVKLSQYFKSKHHITNSLFSVFALQWAFVSILLILFIVVAVIIRLSTFSHTM